VNTISNKEEAIMAIQFAKENLKRYKNLRMGLVGSFVREEGTGRSDIDILVDTASMGNIKRGLLQNRIEEIARVKVLRKCI